MIIIIIWVIVNLALVIPAIFCLLFNLVLERQDDEEGTEGEDKDEATVGAADCVADCQVVNEADDVPDEADSSQHDPRFHEADVPLKNIKIFSSDVQIMLQT